MNTLRKSIALILALTLSLTVFSVFAERDKPLIGIIQIVDHVALDAARQGFIDALAENGYKDGETVTLDYRNAQGSPDVLASIADHFVAENANLVLAIATPSAQSMAGKTESIPVPTTATTTPSTSTPGEPSPRPPSSGSGSTTGSGSANRGTLVRTGIGVLGLGALGLALFGGGSALSRRSRRAR